MTKSILPPPTFITYSLGCRTNQAEVEDIGLQLMAHGFVPFSPKKFPLFHSPALLLLNTCVVTQKAEKETRQKIRELRKKYPESFLAVLGCAVTAKEKFNISLPEVDLLIPNEQKNRTVEIIEQELCSSFTSKILFSNKYTLSGRKFIKIQDGCDKYCSFCITCHLRGKPTSVPSEKIIEEINFWVEKGIIEIILTGINIGLWGKDFRKQESVNSLIKKILAETKVERISFSSIYPEMLLPLTGSNPVNEFLNIVVNNPRISQYFHLSLQSGSQTVLERMNRKTNLNELIKKLQWIKSKNPNFTFRADIITGFPGETEKEFQETLDFIKKAKISFVHHFHFSRRQHTKSEAMIKNKIWKEIPDEIKKQRAERLKKVVEKIRNNEAMKQLNTITNCLIVKKSGRVIAIRQLAEKQSQPNYNNLTGLLRPRLRRSPRNDIEDWEGITENGWLTKIKSQKSKIKNIKGKILPIKISGFEKNYLLGEIMALPT